MLVISRCFLLLFVNKMVEKYLPVVQEITCTSTFFGFVCQQTIDFFRAF